MAGCVSEVVRCVLLDPVGRVALLGSLYWGGGDCTAIVATAMIPVVMATPSPPHQHTFPRLSKGFALVSQMSEELM